MGREILRGEMAKPGLDEVVAALGDIAREVLPEERARLWGVACRNRMGDRAVEIPVLNVPGARAEMKSRLTLWMSVAQLTQEHLAEQAMAAIPTAATVGRLRR